MRSPNNVLFTAIQALFDETLYPKCPDMCHLGYTPSPDQPDGEQGEYNIFLEDNENNGNGGGPLPYIRPGGGPGPHLPPQLLPWQPPQPGYPPFPPSPSNHPSSSTPMLSGMPTHAPSLIGN
jgi:hypothetical protein